MIHNGRINTRSSFQYVPCTPRPDSVLREYDSNGIGYNLVSEIPRETAPPVLPADYQRVVDLLKRNAPSYVSDAEIVKSYRGNSQTQGRDVIHRLRHRYGLNDSIETAPRQSSEQGWRWR